MKMWPLKRFKPGEIGQAGLSAPVNMLTAKSLAVLYALVFPQKRRLFLNSSGDHKAFPPISEAGHQMMPVAAASSMPAALGGRIMRFCPINRFIRQAQAGAGDFCVQL